MISHCGVAKRGMHEIALVGGSTRIPKVQQLLRVLLDGKALGRPNGVLTGVSEGENAKTADSRMMGRPNLEGKPRVEATFGLDTNGVLSVSAR